MMIKNKILPGILAALFPVLCGCGGPPPRGSSAQQEKLPQGLEQLQGSWCWGDEDSGSRSQVRFNGHQMQLSYMDSTNIVRRSAVIQSIDTVQKQLNIHGDKNPWNYSTEEIAGKEQLVLLFLDKDINKWITIRAEKKQIRLFHSD
jgi:hypothetical protein